MRVKNPYKITKVSYNHKNHLVWLFHLSRTSLTGYDALTFVTTPLIVTSQIYHFLVTIVYIHNMDNLPLSVETPETPTT